MVATSTVAPDITLTYPIHETRCHIESGYSELEPRLWRRRGADGVGSETTGSEHGQTGGGRGGGAGSSYPAPSNGYPAGERTPTMQLLAELSAARAELEAPRVLVRCAMCECDQALVRTHADADRVLHTHLAECPGNRCRLSSKPGHSDGTPEVR